MLGTVYISQIIEQEGRTSLFQCSEIANFQGVCKSYGAKLFTLSFGYLMETYRLNKLMDFDIGHQNQSQFCTWHLIKIKILMADFLPKSLCMQYCR